MNFVYVHGRCRESGPAGQYATPPIFTRRRNRSGTSASLEPLSDRSNKPASTAAKLPAQHLCFLPHTGTHASPGKAPAGIRELPDVREAACGGAAPCAVQNERSVCDARPGVQAAIQDGLGLKKHGDSAVPMHASSNPGRGDNQEAQGAPTVSIPFQAAGCAGEAAAEDSVVRNSRKRRRKGSRKCRDDSVAPAQRPAKRAKQNSGRSRRQASKGVTAPARPCTAPSPPMNTPQDSHTAVACEGPVQNHVAAPEGPRGMQHGGIGDGDCAEQPGAVAEQRMQEKVMPQALGHLHSPILKDEGFLLRGTTKTGAPATAAPHPASRRRRDRHASADPAFAITQCAGSGPLDLGASGSGRRAGCARDATPDAAAEKGVTCDASVSRGDEHACDAPLGASLPGDPHLKPRRSCDAGPVLVHHAARDVMPGDIENENIGVENEVAADAEVLGDSPPCAGVALLDGESHAVTPGQELDGITLEGSVGEAGDVAVYSTGARPASRPQEIEAGRSEHMMAARAHAAQQAETDGAGEQNAGMPPNGEGAAGPDGIKWEACATPDRHMHSCTVGPGFVSASELLESQRSGRSQSDAAARSPPGDPVVLPVCELPEATRDIPDFPTPAGCPEGVVLQSSEHTSDAALADGRFSPTGLPLQSSINGPLAREQNRPGPHSHVDIPSIAKAEVFASSVPGLSPASDAMERPDLSDLAFGSLSQWTALSGAEGGHLMVRICRLQFLVNMRMLEFVDVWTVAFPHKFACPVPQASTGPVDQCFSSNSCIQMGVAYGFGKRVVYLMCWINGRLF